MAVITLPVGLIVDRQSWGQKRFDLRFQSGDSGAGQSRILAPPRWTTAISSIAGLPAADSAVWRAMVLALQGQINQLAVYDLSNPAPAGTLRGSLVLTAAAAAGATTISLTGGAGQAVKTLLAGDWLGIGAGSTRQLVSVAADVTTDASGSAVVAIAQPSRYLQASGSAVVWDKPTALFRVTGDTSNWQADGWLQGGYSLDLMESWE